MRFSCRRSLDGASYALPYTMLNTYPNIEAIGGNANAAVPIQPQTQPIKRPVPTATIGLGLLAIAVKTAITKSDSDKAWAKLLSAAQPFMRSVAYRSLGDDVDADDLLSAAQLGFVAAVQSWDHVAYPAGFASWARQMMRTEVRSAVRAARTIRGRKDSDVMTKIGSDSIVWQGHVDEE